MEILFAAAVLPAIVLMAYVYKKDTVEKEPMGLIVRLFVLGMVAGPLAGIVETLIFEGMESIIAPGVTLLILENFIGVALVEEGFKYLFLNTVRNNPQFDYVFDAIVYSVAVALGFAALENLLYVFDGGLETALVRAVFSVPGHCADGVVMGVFYGMAKQREVAGDARKARHYRILCVALPTIEHGIYDSLLSTDSELLMGLAMVGQLAFIIFGMYMVKKVSKNDVPIYGMARQQHLLYVNTPNAHMPQPPSQNAHAPYSNTQQPPAPGQFQNMPPNQNTQPNPGNSQTNWPGQGK